MSLKLHSVIKKTPDVLLIVCISIAVASVLLGWYIFSFRSFSYELKRLSLETTQLHKRLASLKKRSVKYAKTDAQLKELQETIEQEVMQFPQTLFKAEQLLLAHIKKSKLHLAQWKPGKKEEQSSCVSRLISCEFDGSYNQLIAFLKSLEKAITCKTSTIAKTKKGLIFKAEFIVFSRRER